ncbi:hypothetical protein [Geobacter sulfurreducens]|uniref:hypothetical protein n=1 Tax=Geobacter sulfurreducens TaxID=35554 RepID=UPI002B544F89|nr:hypothetical protein [Geobacter sulfurreducens]HML78714.1 hypothetical protein [Geobacter sulfurreducens]
MKIHKYPKIILLYAAMAISCFLSDGCATSKLSDHADRISHPTNELISEAQILSKYTHDAVINNDIYYVFYSDTMLYGEKRRGYFLASKLSNNTIPNWSYNYIITDNIDKYKLILTTSKGEVKWRPLIADAIIDNHQYNYDIAGPVSSYDLRWVKRSHTEYFLTKSLYIISIPYDVVTFPVQAIKVLTTPW